jgi:hypothetical protein
MKSSLRSLIPFLQFLLNHLRLSHFSAPCCNFQFLCSQAHILAGWRLETRVDSLRLLNRSLLYNHYVWPRRKHRLSIVEKVCLQRCCIATEVTQLFFVYFCRGNVFIETMPSNDRPFWLRYSGFRMLCHKTHLWEQQLIWQQFSL